MREAHPIERQVGLRYYASDAEGTGGRLRERPADFQVRELERVEAAPLDADPGSYPHVVVRATLRGWDTNDFASALSNRLGISRERVSWAGTKDKHAITTQLFSIQGIDPGQLPTVADADLELVGRTGRPVLFGDLAGNAFEIVVNEPARPENATVITDQLRAFGGSTTATGVVADEAGKTGVSDSKVVPIGVPNYFGQQRFGSRRPVTHAVGLAIVRGDWKKAVMTYVGNPHRNEPEDTQEARRFVEKTRDWTAALERFPGRLGYERAILHRLAERGVDSENATGEDFRAALDAFPKNLQQLFVNAAQSYLFNRIVSERLSRGLALDRAVAGDVVCFADRDAPAGLALPDVDRAQRVSETQVETVDRHCARGRAFVTAPLIGTDTAFAGGTPGAIERAVLTDAGLERRNFDRPDPYGSSGTRRAVLIRTEIAIEYDPLTFAFRLPKGSYATSLLREYLKSDPSTLG